MIFSVSGTLILTEGDSANALALAGLSEVGSKYYGTYPLKGKILNGYNASNDKWSKNAVIQDVIQCLGLKHKKIYNNVNHYLIVFHFYFALLPIYHQHLYF